MDCGTGPQALECNPGAVSDNVFDRKRETQMMLCLPFSAIFIPDLRSAHGVVGHSADMMRQGHADTQSLRQRAAANNTELIPQVTG